MEHYRHTQSALLWLLPAGHAVVFAGIMLLVDLGPDLRPWLPWMLALGTVAPALLAMGTMHLTIADEGARLAARYGPLPMIWATIPYENIVAVQRARTTFQDGWGVHLVPGRGMVVNLWGMDAVKVDLREPQWWCRTYYLGTDDPDGLLAYLQQRMAGSATADSSHSQGE